MNINHLYKTYTEFIKYTKKEKQQTNEQSNIKDILYSSICGRSLSHMDRNTRQ